MSELLEVIDGETEGRAVKVLFSTDVASEGLNLHQFNVVVNYDAPWSPVRREQRIGRAHRLRQTRNCCVIDFIRDVRVDYEFYTKLVLKLLNMIEQRIYSKPLEGVLELYVVEKRGEEPVLQISEKDLASALCRVYEEYYGGGELDRVLEEARARLGRVLMEHKSLVEELTSSYTADSLRSYVKDLTGCEDEECFKKTLCGAYEAIHGGVCGEDLSRVILDLYEELLNGRYEEIDSSFAIVLNDPKVEKGYFGVLDFMLNGEVRYSTPILVLFRSGAPEVLHGLEVLEALANYWKSGGLRLVKLPTGVGSGDLSEFESVVKLFLDRVNFRFNERYRFRVNELYELTRDQSLVYTPLSHRLRSPILRVLGVQGLVDYESFLTGLPRSVRERMEVESVNLVQELFVKKGCRVLEVNIGVYKPYDLLVECPCNGGFVKYMVEVKSHLKRILVAELTPSETRVAEENPRNYIVCNVAGLESDDKSTWIILCDLYENARKEIVTRMKEERIARIFFDKNH